MSPKGKESKEEISALLARARRHLSRRDPVLKRLSAAVGPCTLRLEPNGFACLVRSIISQQISTRAALAIANRLREKIAGAEFDAALLLALSEQELRGAGLSAAKSRSIHDLASKVQEKAVVFQEMNGRTDEEIIAHLIPVRGIGRWTAEMFLIFSLGRLDVLPVGDFGLRAAVRQQYGLEELPNAVVLKELAEGWRPYRTVATWYFWRSLGVVPQSEVAS